MLFFRVVGMVSLCAVTAAWGVEDERRKPLEPEPPAPKPSPLPESKPQAPAADKTLVAALTGARFVSRPDLIQKPPTFSGIEVLAVPLLDSAAFRERIQPFLGKPISLKSIREMGRQVTLHFRTHDRPFVVISVPEQDITKGQVQFLVSEGKLGAISIEGNRWFRTSQYRELISLLEGAPISEKALIRDLNYINENAFRSVKPVFRPGLEPGETELVLQARERFPVRVYTGYEDTGTQTTGHDRLLAGFNWNNGFMHGHEIGYQYATDIEGERLLSHSAYWRIPLPHRHKLAIFGGLSDVKATLNEDLESLGTSWQAGLRYSAPLPDLPHLGAYRHEAQAGFDFKQSESSLLFGGEEVFSSKFDIAQFTLQYSGQAVDALGSTQFSLNGFFSPGRWTPCQSKKSYQEARAGTLPQ